jgi:hypothetical protein
MPEDLHQRLPWDDAELSAARRAKLPNDWQKRANTVALNSQPLFNLIGLMAVFSQISANFCFECVIWSCSSNAGS